MPFGMHDCRLVRQGYGSVTPVSLPDILRPAEWLVRAAELARAYWAFMPTFLGTGAKTHSADRLRRIRDHREQHVTYCKKT